MQKEDDYIACGGLLVGAIVQSISWCGVVVRLAEYQFGRRRRYLSEINLCELVLERNQPSKIRHKVVVYESIYLGEIARVSIFVPLVVRRNTKESLQRAIDDRVKLRFVIHRCLWVLVLFFLNAFD